MYCCCVAMQEAASREVTRVEKRPGVMRNIQVKEHNGMRKASAGNRLCDHGPAFRAVLFQFHQLSTLKVK